MVRICIAVLCLAMAVALYRAADVSSLHTAWLMLLAWATGTISGVLIVLDWIIDGTLPKIFGKRRVKL